MIRKVIKNNFWHPKQNDDNTNLYEDELGWKESNRSDAHSTDSWNIFKFYLDHYSFDLALYFVPKDEFYYIDNMQNHEVLKLKKRDDWDGLYISERVEFSHFPQPEPETVYEYKDIHDLWTNLRIDDLSLKDVIDQSVVFILS